VQNSIEYVGHPETDVLALLCNDVLADFVPEKARHHRETKGNRRKHLK
jgi:hypothetical protein